MKSMIKNIRKNMVKGIKKILRSALALTLAFALFLTTTGVFAYANAAAYAEKEEVIYVTADANGKVREINAVNIFDGEEAGGTITDYGDYSAVKLLTGEGEISQSGKKISMDVGSDKIYYQGTLKTTEIPWNINIAYYMDGKEYEPEEIPGKSGKLKIHFVVTENSEYSGDFYDNYALQAAFTLDTEKCSNIKAADATIANVGQDKQLSYIILPGKGIDTYITADAKNFEMDAVSINGIKLNLNIDVDYTDMDKKADDAKEAARELDEGAGEAEDGAEKIKEATEELAEKIAELYDGTGKLTEGAEELSGGMTEITDKNTELTDGAYKAFEGICEASETIINEKLTESGMSKVSLTPKNYAAVLIDLLEKLEPAAVYNKAYNTALYTVTAEVEKNADALYYAAAEKIVEQQMAEAATKTQQKDQSEQAQQTERKEEQTEDEESSSEGEGENAESTTRESAETQQQSAEVSIEEQKKEQAIEAVLAAMTEEQKAQIKSAAIQQGMASSDVTSQISAAVSSASKASTQIQELKEQLDEYQKFYDGVCDYTAAVSKAKDGAGELSDNMETLEENTGLLKDAIEEFCEKMEELRDGISKLKEGTAEFFDEISGLKGEIHDKVSEMIDELKGSGILRSFTSDKNTDVESVQFVIKTEAISIAEPTQEETTTVETLSFWQKLIRLFKE